MSTCSPNTYKALNICGADSDAHLHINYDVVLLCFSLKSNHWFPTSTHAKPGRTNMRYTPVVGFMILQWCERNTNLHRRISIPSLSDKPATGASVVQLSQHSKAF